MLLKIKNKIKTVYKKQKKFLETKLFKVLGRSDKARWSKTNLLFHDWDERTALLAAHIPEKSTVFEFGAARLSLKGMLPQGCTYLHSDIVARDKNTYVVDLNKQFPDIPKVDVVVFSGVLEYLYKVPELMLHLKDTTDILLFSYATYNAYPNISKRRVHGWISDHRLETLEELAKTCNFESELIGYWRKQHLFKWKKIN